MVIGGSAASREGSTRSAPSKSWSAVELVHVMIHRIPAPSAACVVHLNFKFNQGLGFIEYDCILLWCPTILQSIITQYQAVYI